MPAVSVIVPNYNHAAFLRQRIDSILNQTFQDFEIILLDDRSIDESRTVMQSYAPHPKVSHVIFNEVNTGSAFSQWEKGIALAKGEWLWIAESDDWAEQEFLATLMAEAARHPHCGLLVSIPQYCYPDGKTWNQDADGSVVESTGQEYARQHMACANPIHNVSSVLLRRSDVCRLDLSNITSMRLCGDWLLYAMMCRITNVLEINKVLCHYRIHGTNVTTWAEQKGLPLIEGVEVLDFLTHFFNVKPQDFAKSWGRTWAKLDRKCRFEPEVRKKIHEKMSPYPAIRFWHNLYRIRLCLK